MVPQLDKALDVVDEIESAIEDENASPLPQAGAVPYLHRGNQLHYERRLIAKYNYTNPWSSFCAELLIMMDQLLTR